MKKIKENLHCDLLSISDTWLSDFFQLQSSSPPILELRMLSCGEVNCWVNPFFAPVAVISLQVRLFTKGRR